jgi:hypothetical protein
MSVGFLTLKRQFGAIATLCEESIGQIDAMMAAANPKTVADAGRQSDPVVKAVEEFAVKLAPGEKFSMKDVRARIRKLHPALDMGGTLNWAVNALVKSHILDRDGEGRDAIYRRNPLNPFKPTKELWEAVPRPLPRNPGPAPHKAVDEDAPAPAMKPASEAAIAIGLNLSEPFSATDVQGQLGDPNLQRGYQFIAQWLQRGWLSKSGYMLYRRTEKFGQ